MRSADCGMRNVECGCPLLPWVDRGGLQRNLCLKNFFGKKQHLYTLCVC